MPKRTSANEIVAMRKSSATASRSERRLAGGSIVSFNARDCSRVREPPISLCYSRAPMPLHDKKVVAVLPAYNAEKTLRATFDDIPQDWVDEILLVDDVSRDKTVELARTLPMRVVVHPKNRGYGGNQKTCYRTAMDEMGGEIMVMVHPDHQYDPKIIPQLVEPLLRGDSDAVFVSRMLGGRPMEGGMPKWKYLANLFLTMVENATFYIFLSEYHSGFRAYSKRYLDSINFEANSDDFVFDTEIIAQGVAKGMRIREVPISTRYFDEASQIGFWRSVRYGRDFLNRMLLYKFQKKHICSHGIFPEPQRPLAAVSA